MKVASVVLVIAGFAQNTQCFFPLFFPGPIIYPKTTTEAPKPTEAPPPPAKTIIHHYVPQKHHYHHYQPHYVSYHHVVENDESNSVEEYTEEVTEPPTTPKPTTTTTTTPEPTTKKHHYYRLVYPKPPPIYHPLAYLKHHFGGYNRHPPVHYLPPFHPHEYPAARHQVETFVPEPDEFDGEGYPVEKPTEPPPPPPPAPTTTAAPEPTTKKHRYHTYVRPKHPPSYSRHHGGYEGPRVRYYPASYPKRPVEQPTPPQSGENDSDASPPSMQSPSPPPTPMDTEEPFHEPVYKSRPNQRRPPSPGQPYPDQFQNPMLQRPSEPVYRLNQAPGRTPAPPPALFAPDVVASTPAVVPEVSTPTSVDVQVKKSVQLPVYSVKNLAPPVRVDGSKYEYWNRRDSTQNPNLEPDFDSASFNFIREMIANSTRTPS
ncbi:Hypothetical predicted protein [Cloeon dipterum]|uniref:Uncharacterized protein n=1 Tax=Cloeon dipterum TaxID=197152 RepID=A0A8S1CU04_9INSE|nr:Hypothetical predicted protein [Cloeon dipterum]